MNDSREIWQLVDAKKDALIALSDWVWATPELCYGETRSAAEHAAELERHGLRITRNVAQGAALMTETSVTAQIISAVSNLLGNDPLERAMNDVLQQLGPPPFDEADRSFAKQIQATLTDQDIDSVYRTVGEPRDHAPLCDKTIPFMRGSTDVGDVSWAIPTVQAHGAMMAIGTPLHSWQVVAQGKMPAAHKGLVHVAKVMAATAPACLERDWRCRAARIPKT